MPCRRCGHPRVSRPRGLCWACFYTPGVKELYPSTSKYARRGVGNTTGGYSPPAPTDERPGTPGKLAVLEGRAAAGLALFHPADPRLEPYRGPPPGIRLLATRRKARGGITRLIVE